jgi:hypothetical protein
VGKLILAFLFFLASVVFALRQVPSAVPLGAPAPAAVGARAGF